MSDEDEYKNDMKETDPSFYKAIGKLRKDSSPIGFQEWNLFDEDQLAAFFNELMRKGMEHATENYECWAWFTRENGDEAGDTPMSPTTFAVQLPIGESDMEGPAWNFTLEEMVDDLIDGWEAGNRGPIDDEGRPHVIAVRDDLRRLADKLDAALRRKRRPKTKPKVAI